MTPNAGYPAADPLRTVYAECRGLVGTPVSERAA
jgi:hypothetical protein